MLDLYDYVTIHGKNDIADWRASLQKPDRAKLDQKLERLQQVSYDLAVHTHLLAGPVFEHVYKLRVNASVMLRPHLCRGPITNEKEYTLLVGAIEIGDRLPHGIQEMAASRRRDVLLDPRRRRMVHGLQGVMRHVN